MKKTIKRISAFAIALVCTLGSVATNNDRAILHAEAASKGVKISQPYVFFCSELVGPSCSPQNYVLDIAGGKTANGTNCQLYTYNKTESQLFKAVCVGNDKNGYYYKFERYGTNKVLDVAGGKVANGTNIQLYKSNGTKAQQWYLTPAGNNRYYIRSRLNFNYVLDVKNGNAKNGTNIQLYKINYTSAQKFGFKSSVNGSLLMPHKGGKLHWVLVNNTTGDMIWVLARECKVCGKIFSHSTWTLPNKDED